MRSSRTRFSLLTATFSLLTSACAPSLHDQKVDAAKAARAKGDLGAEALAWMDACQLEPKDTTACREAARTAVALEATTLQRVRVSCHQSLDQCTADLVALRRIRPNHPEAIALLREAEGLHREGCKKLENVAKPSTMLARWNCMASLATRVNDPAYDTMLAEERSFVGKRFVFAGRSATPGAAYVYYRTAQCFSREEEDGSATQAAGDAFVRGSAVPIAVRTRASGASMQSGSMAACSYIAAALGPRAYCSNGPGVSPDFSVDLGLFLGAVDHRVSSERRIAEYVSGYEDVPNPARPSAEAAVSRAQASFDAIEQTTLDREARCKQRYERHACDSYNAIVPTYNQRKSALVDAQNDLNRTPILLRREIVERVPYDVHHHFWSVAYSVDARSLSGTNANEAGSFQEKDSEHPSVPPAGVRADGLVVPTTESWNQSLRGVAKNITKQVFDASFRKLATCGGDAFALDDVAALECRARSELYLKGELPKPAAWGVECK